MKVPPKRKGNVHRLRGCGALVNPSMKVPPKRKGNKSPGELWDSTVWPSMKVPPKRKGNFVLLVEVDDF